MDASWNMVAIWTESGLSNREGGEKIRPYHYPALPPAMHLKSWFDALYIRMEILYSRMTLFWLMLCWWNVSWYLLLYKILNAQGQYQIHRFIEMVTIQYGDLYTCWAVSEPIPYRWLSTFSVWCMSSLSASPGYTNVVFINSQLCCHLPLQQNPWWLFHTYAIHYCVMISPALLSY